MSAFGISPILESSPAPFTTASREPISAAPTTDYFLAATSPSTSGIDGDGQTTPQIRRSSEARFKQWPTIHEHIYQTRSSAKIPGTEVHRESYTLGDATDKTSRNARASSPTDIPIRKTPSVEPFPRRDTSGSRFTLSRQSTSASSISTMARGIVKGIPDLRMFPDTGDEIKPALKKKRTFSIFSSKKEIPDTMTLRKEKETPDKLKNVKNDAEPPSKGSVKDRRNLDEHGKALKMAMPSVMPDLPPRSRSPISSQTFVGAVCRPRSPKTPFPVDIEPSHYLAPGITSIPESVRIVTPNEDIVRNMYHQKPPTDSPSSTRGNVRRPGHFRTASNRSSDPSVGSPEPSRKYPLRGWLGQSPSAKGPETGGAETDRFDEAAGAESKQREDSKTSLGSVFKFPLSLVSGSKVGSPLNQPKPENLTKPIKRASISNAVAAGYKHSPVTIRRLFSRSDRSAQGPKTPPSLSTPVSVDREFNPFKFSPPEAVRIPTPPPSFDTVKFDTGDLFYDTQRRAAPKDISKQGGVWDSDTLLMSQARIFDTSGSEGDSPNEGPPQSSNTPPLNASQPAEWFRVQALDEGENDTGNSGRLEMGVEVTREEFDWIVPDHLPGSPLCPLSPKHQSGGMGICVYHGRNKTHKSEADWRVRDSKAGIPRFQ
ncbi:uncharacterized protein BDZ99DRAFT_109045 [Mytilinidion resinicola]|uniref:Uncharacterized protein n=1 Tax=Mytilinidion resinicola TaxID=574789 RepID=A0A6A6YAX8_9PEZI|nr:uncharacterized protein BDZ99DRAFT_109045 [Mytilinidion resinicola]KAF2805653.1 hypothetical protein BDZ99DRAFT_109045 [Mytilinidion resinicola]